MKDKHEFDDHEYLRQNKLRDYKHDERHFFLNIFHFDQCSCKQVNYTQNTRNTENGEEYITGFILEQLKLEMGIFSGFQDFTFLHFQK